MIFKGLSIKQITQFFLEGESPTLKYLSNFFRSLEMPLINCKIKLNLTWKKECVLSSQRGDAVFIINDTKLYVPVVTLSKEDNKDFIEQQNKGFQRSIYWNEYKIKECR